MESLCELLLRSADTRLRMGDDGSTYITPPSQAMSEEQFSALLAKIKDDAGLKEKLKGAADLDACVALAKEAGFDVSKADWLKYQSERTLELSDEELEGVTGGKWSDNCTRALGCF